MGAAHSERAVGLGLAYMGEDAAWWLSLLCSGSLEQGQHFYSSTKALPWRGGIV